MITSTSNAASPKVNTPPLGLNASSGSTGPSAANLTGANFARLLNDQAAPVPHTDPMPVPPAAAAPAPAPASPNTARTTGPAPAPSTPDSAAPAANRKTATTTPGAKPASASPGKPTDAQNAALHHERVPVGEAADDPSSTADTDAGTDTQTGDADASLAELTQLIGLSSNATQVPATALPDPNALPVARAATALTTGTDVAGTDTKAGTAALATAATSERPSAGARHTRGLNDGNEGGAETAASADSANAKADAAAPDAAGDLRSDRSAGARTEGLTDTPVPNRSAANTAALAARDSAASHSAERTAALDALSRPLSATPAPAADANAANPAAFATLMQQSLSAVAGGAAGGTLAPATDRVHASLHSTAFAPELATRVSLMAVDGVQQAELQLNPAEMGPVTVQIVVDGSQAQVSFQAAQADTRQALEQSLPDLAAALQGQGLTLAGGGVFQQAPQDRGAQNAANGDTRDGATTGRSGSGGSVASAAATNTPAPRRTVGLLDTFA